MADDLRTVATFATPTDAALARNALADAGIDAAIADELTLTADPFLAGALGFIKVQVRASDLERAAEVLGRRGMPLPADFEGNGHAEPDEVHDDFPAVSAGERLVEFAYRAAVMGLLACPPVLHVYSLALLLWVGAVHHDLPPAANRKYWAALGIDVAVITIAALLVRGLMGV